MGNKLEAATYRSAEGGLTVSVVEDQRLMSLTIDVSHEDCSFAEEVLGKLGDIVRTFSNDVVGTYDCGKFPTNTMKVEHQRIDSRFDFVFYV